MPPTPLRPATSWLQLQVLAPALAAAASFPLAAPAPPTNRFCVMEAEVHKLVGCDPLKNRGWHV